MFGFIESRRILKSRKKIKWAAETLKALFKAVRDNDVASACLGVASGNYTTEFKNNQQLCISILREFGLGKRVMETRILMEAEEMIKGIQEKQGRPFDVEPLIMSTIGNVTLAIAFGRRCDHSEPDFQQLITDTTELISKIPVELEMFPLLRSFPNYKRKVAELGVTMQRICDFVTSKIEFCRQVLTR